MTTHNRITSLLAASRAILWAKRRARLRAEGYVLLRLVPAWLAERMSERKSA